MARPQVKTEAQMDEALDTPVNKRTEEKKLEIGRDAFGLYLVRFNAGGEIPDSLKTLFTSANKAEEAINQYNAKKLVEVSV
ncbi:hypothetical protein UFOVP1528_47 [uncultured Caudovirales phage]|uniref:Uncharacterized protein n=1 Tax=uncultured Caudovirales phage TaxID=2100421 RepID=A0A6J5PLH3_9CAUD|nr:hypothetical protein UFOVP905_29 [uncultured Caudovirales phage]CAB4182672.1 hypothetical protein UFOVP1080_16 [uncultured Caudovirales phage]CAB4197211.1 hypothetical protein UFOVP1321_4 [uncultured Caudovirales phage]CAB4212366.1 hypothetical protein UFOVP1432_10 [uncultured Caudovirales phage]CAB5227512.1 hypothetical protein UFOVP1528_47 [uncultured Caudovirales phage]